jgi:hypothetical protein
VSNGAYVVEVYEPRTGAGGGAAAAARARSVSEEMRTEGNDVRFLRSIFLPGDEMCFYVFEAASPLEVAEAAARAGICASRVVAAVSIEATHKE